MDHKVTPISPRIFAKPFRRTRRNFSQANSWIVPPLQHPAFSYPTEEVSIHHSLDLSFQGGIAVSLLDRKLIDNLIRIEHPLSCAELLASGF